MKYLVFSDLHGSYSALKEVEKKYLLHNCDKLICLGDLLYHGPRNDLPNDYDPKKVFSLLQSYLDKFIWIQGNCDAEVDEMVLSFKIRKDHTLTIKGKKILLTHGHHINYLSPTDKKVDAILHGHTHIIKVDKVNNQTYVNIGSITLPKENSKRCYGILENNIISIYSIDDKLIISEKL